MAKTPKQLERYFKGVANHHRIQILNLLQSEGHMTLFDISEKLKVHITTASEHTMRLVKAGLINKEYKGKFVFHSLSPYGSIMLDAFEKFE